MACRQVEKLLLRSFDGLLGEEEERKLDAHFKSCPSCMRMRKEYEIIFGSLRSPDQEEPLPRFWERLEPRLDRKDRFLGWPSWELWSLKAVAISLVVIFLVLGTMLMFLPRPQDELSQTEILLLRNINPIQDARVLFEEERPDRRNMMLIFSAMDENNRVRRYLP